MLTNLVAAKALALLLQSQSSQAETPSADPTIGVVGQCDPQEGPGLTWTAEAREETRARVQATCRAVGASKAVCEWLDVSVVRESSGRPGVRHTRALGEFGLGPLGLSLRWHHDKWPGKDEDPAFCSPEVSALVALEIAHRAVDRYEADDLVGIQSIFGGHWRCFRDIEAGGDKVCYPSRQDDVVLCSALGARGIDCFDKVTQKDLGRRVPIKKRRETAESLAAKFGVARK